MVLVTGVSPESSDGCPCKKCMGRGGGCVRTGLDWSGVVTAKDAWGHQELQERLERVLPESPEGTSPADT